MMTGATPPRAAMPKVLLALSPLLPPILFPGIGTLVSLAIVLLSLTFVRASRMPTLSFTGGAWRKMLLLGLVAGVTLSVAINFAIEPGLEALFGRDVYLEDFAAVRGNLEAYLMMLAVGLIFGGVIEELIFRGFVIGWGTALLGERAAIWLALLSAAAFGITHLYQGWVGVLSTGLAGLAFGLVYLRAGRALLPAIIVHMLMNLVGITLIYLGLD